MSPILYCIYIDSLFDLLRKRKTGCWVKGSFVGIVGYADDLLLLSPSLDGLQEMVKTCEDYGTTHNLTFSTNPDHKKCKTKCIAFLTRERPLKNINLNGSELPWVNSTKHLGCKISQNIHGLTQDIMEKRALYINRVNELIQEFHFAHPLTKIKINNIFNTHFYGSQLWDLFSEEAVRLEHTWNISQRKLLSIPRNTHRYFIEPLTETKHIKFALLKRFVNFVNNLAKSTKMVIKNMLSCVKYECRSTTGHNLRQIMLLVNKTNVDEITTDDFRSQIYNVVPNVGKWKINLAKEIIEVINRNLEMGILDTAELDDILEHILT